MLWSKNWELLGELQLLSDMTPRTLLGLGHVLEQLSEPRQTLTTFTSSLKDVTKDSDEQPEEGRDAQGEGWRVPMELGCTTRKLPEPCEGVINPISSPLPSLEELRGPKMPSFSSWPGLSGTSPRPGALQSH